MKERCYCCRRALPSQQYTVVSLNRTAQWGYSCPAGLCALPRHKNCSGNNMTKNLQHPPGLKNQRFESESERATWNMPKRFLLPSVALMLWLICLFPRKLLWFLGKPGLWESRWTCTCWRCARTRMLPLRNVLELVQPGNCFSSND